MPRFLTIKISYESSLVLMFDIDVSPHTLTSARVFHNNERTPQYLRYTIKITSSLSLFYLSITSHLFAIFKEIEGALRNQVIPRQE